MKVRPGLFVLGAGFSVPARLPAGVDLWREVRKRATSLSNDPEYRFSKFRDDLAAYIDFRARCDAKKLDADDVNLEEFMGFRSLNTISDFVVLIPGPGTETKHNNAKGVNRSDTYRMHAI